MGEPAIKQTTLPGQGMEGEDPKLDRVARQFIAAKDAVALATIQMNRLGDKVEAAMDESGRGEITVEGVKLKLNTTESLTLSGWKRPHADGEDD